MLKTVYVKHFTVTVFLDLPVVALFTLPEPCRRHLTKHTVQYLPPSPVCTCVQSVASRRVACGNLLHFLSLSFPLIDALFLSITLLSILLSSPLLSCVFVLKMTVKKKKETTHICASSSWVISHLCHVVAIQCITYSMSTILVAWQVFHRLN